jgi:two-component system chemotaxis response regulator CheB
MKKVFLQPGELAFQKEPAHITTIVGSCISVCIWDKDLHYGGMCHYYLPTRSQQHSPDNNYGEKAIPNLLKKFKHAGSLHRSLVAKIVGGGHVIDVELGSDRDVGDANIKIAVETLGKFAIPIVGRAIGGQHGKKVSFNTATGLVEFQNLRRQSDKDQKSQKIKVLIIDDAKPIRMIYRKMIERDPDFEIIGEADEPLSALKIIARTPPDVMTLDLKMPVMDGITYLRTHWQKNPIPLVVISSLNLEESADIFDAMELGAFDYMQKPTFSDLEGLTFDLHQKLKAAYATKDKVRIAPKLQLGASPSLPRRNDVVSVAKTKTSLILIGSSTGGTEVVKSILSRMPATIPPILIVQHMPALFTTQFAARLSQLCAFRVIEAADRMKIEDNTAYLAPGGRQMAIKELSDGSLQICITDDPPVNRFKPSVDYLFKSAVHIKERKLLAIILTGMGADGAEGMLQLREQKKAHTIAQDEASSTVFGMPGAAIDKGAVVEIKSQDSIPYAILSWLSKT